MRMLAGLPGIVEAGEQVRAFGACPGKRARMVGQVGDHGRRSIPGDAGLARLFTGSCGSAADYIVGESNIQPTNSACINGDPVCGVPHLASNSAPLAAAQLATAAGCAIYNGCAHYQYVHDGDVANMASWMLSDTT
jgi:hypothetical protein